MQYVEDKLLNPEDNYNVIDVDITNIINAACETIGIRPSEVLTMLEREFNRPIILTEILAQEWIWLCEFLLIELNSLQYGYDRCFHLQEIERAKLEGRYHFGDQPYLQTMSSLGLLH